jgi:hypothetical protein
MMKLAESMNEGLPNEIEDDEYAIVNRSIDGSHKLYDPDENVRVYEDGVYLSPEFPFV